ncbi:hypothetical protein TPA0907_29110 [Micromonospora humidisoli]|nr:hypothetical protein TPA0907_29110 [Micromonospora sp. AKA109]
MVTVSSAAAVPVARATAVAARRSRLPARGEVRLVAEVNFIGSPWIGVGAVVPPHQLTPPPGVPGRAADRSG